MATAKKSAEKKPVAKAAPAKKPAPVKTAATKAETKPATKAAPAKKAEAKPAAKAATAAKKTEAKPAAKAAAPAKKTTATAKPAATKAAPAAKKPAPKATAPANKAAATAKPAATKATAKPVKNVAPKQVEDDNIILLGNEPATPSYGKFVIVKGDNPVKPYVFQLKANNGQVLYESEGYKIKPKKASILAFKKAVQHGEIAIDREKNGTFRYKLYKEDGTLLGVGESYKTWDRAESAAESVKSFAQSANFIEDLSTDKD